MRGVFEDGKTFVDAIAQYDPEFILSEYRRRRSSPEYDTIDVERALAGLAQENEIAAEMIQLHWHFGVDAIELESLYGVSEASVTRTLRFARAWLSDFSRRQSARSPQFERAPGAELARAVN